MPRGGSDLGSSGLGEGLRRLLTRDCRAAVTHAPGLHRTTRAAPARLDAAAAADRPPAPVRLRQLVVVYSERGRLSVWTTASWKERHIPHITLLLCAQGSSKWPGIVVWTFEYTRLYELLQFDIT